MARRGRKPAEVNEVLRKDVFKRPEFLDRMPSKGQRGKAIAMLSEKIRAMSSSETVAHSVNEFIEMFAVKDGELQKVMNYVRAQLRSAYSVKEPRVHHETTSGKIYIWSGHVK